MVDAAAATVAVDGWGWLVRSLFCVYCCYGHLPSASAERRRNLNEAILTGLQRWIIIDVVDVDACSGFSFFYPGYLCSGKKEIETSLDGMIMNFKEPNR